MADESAQVPAPAVVQKGMQTRDFVVEHGPTRNGPWETFKVVRNVRVGAAAVPAARLCRDTYVAWVRIRCADQDKAWAVWRPR